MIKNGISVYLKAQKATLHTINDRNRIFKLNSFFCFFLFLASGLRKKAFAVIEIG